MYPYYYPYYYWPYFYINYNGLKYLRSCYCIPNCKQIPNLCCNQKMDNPNPCSKQKLYYKPNPCCKTYYSQKNCYWPNPKLSCEKNRYYWPNPNLNCKKKQKKYYWPNPYLFCNCKPNPCCNYKPNPCCNYKPKPCCKPSPCCKPTPCCNSKDDKCCINPEWINEDSICTEEYNPVMGCDKKLYDNPCKARSKGVTKYEILNTCEKVNLEWDC